MSPMRRDTLDFEPPINLINLETNAEEGSCQAGTSLKGLTLTSGVCLSWNMI